MSFVVFINGLVLVFMAVFLGLDALVFPKTFGPFGYSAILIGLIGTLLSISTSSSSRQMRRAHTFLLTSSVWLTAAIAGAAPLFMWSLSPADALFESMSGLTTTGSTVMSGLDATPRGIIFWRALLQAIGGIGFIVTGIALLPILKIGGMQLFRTESSEGDKELGNATRFASATLQIYLALMGLCALVYLAGGMSGFDAITHAMTTLSTGGYSGHDASFGYFQSPFLQWSATLFMLLGALPFAWYIRVLTKQTFRSEQIQAMLLSLTLVIACLTTWLVATQDTDALTALRLVAFNVVSVVTTTGFATTDYTLWGPFAVTAFFALTAVGGCTGSTAGGAKAMRWLLLFRAIKAQLQTLHSPNRIAIIKYEGRRVEDDVLNGVIAFFILYFATFGALAILLFLFGLDLSTSVSGALTAITNVGPGVGSIIGPAGNFATFTDPEKLIMVFGMYCGRLEFLTLLVLLSPTLWREL